MNVSKRSLVITEEQERCLNIGGLGAVRPTHLLLYDDREPTPVVVKSGGWLPDGDGDAQSHQTGPQGVCDLEKMTHRCDAWGQV